MEEIPTDLEGAPDSLVVLGSLDPEPWQSTLHYLFLRLGFVILFSCIL